MPHAKLTNRLDGKFELETRRNNRLRKELVSLPKESRVFDGRINRWVLNAEIKPRVLQLLATYRYEIEEQPAAPPSSLETPSAFQVTLETPRIPTDIEH
jgi:hypothetical protein